MIRLLVALMIFGAAARADEYPDGPDLRWRDLPYARFHVERVIDADTYEGTLFLANGSVHPKIRIRLQCVQSPEARGRNVTPEGKMLTGLVRHWIEGHDILVSNEGDGGFSRILSDAFVPGWPETIPQRLNRLRWWSSPLYTGDQTTIEKIMACARRMAK